MKAFPWLLAGLGIGAVAVLVFTTPEAEVGDPDVNRIARKAGTWGAKQRMEGVGGNLVGAAKQKWGEATGNYDLADEGAGDQTIGHIKDAAGKVADKASDVLREFNRP